MLWLIDGTLVRSMVSLFDGKSSLLDPEDFTGDNKNPHRKNGGKQKKQEQANPLPFKIVDTGAR